MPSGENTVLDKLHLGTSYSAIGPEFNVNVNVNESVESIIY